MGTYFEISKPCGVKLCFKNILKRTNSPFLLTLRLPSPLDNAPVQVSVVNESGDARDDRDARKICSNLGASRGKKVKNYVSCSER